MRQETGRVWLATCKSKYLVKQRVWSWTYAIEVLHSENYTLSISQYEVNAWWTSQSARGRFDLITIHLVLSLIIIISVHAWKAVCMCYISTCMVYRYLLISFAIVWNMKPISQGMDLAATKLTQWRPAWSYSKKQVHYASNTGVPGSHVGPIEKVTSDRFFLYRSSSSTQHGIQF